MFDTGGTLAMAGWITSGDDFLSRSILQIGQDGAGRILDVILGDADRVADEGKLLGCLAHGALRKPGNGTRTPLDHRSAEILGHAAPFSLSRLLRALRGSSGIRPRSAPPR